MTHPLSDYLLNADYSDTIKLANDVMNFVKVNNITGRETHFPMRRAAQMLDMYKDAGIEIKAGDYITVNVLRDFTDESQVRSVTVYQYHGAGRLSTHCFRVSEDSEYPDYKNAYGLLDEPFVDRYREDTFSMLKPMVKTFAWSPSTAHRTAWEEYQSILKNWPWDAPKPPQWTNFDHRVVLHGYFYKEMPDTDYESNDHGLYVRKHGALSTSTIRIRFDTMPVSGIDLIEISGLFSNERALDERYSEIFAIINKEAWVFTERFISEIETLKRRLNEYRNKKEAARYQPKVVEKKRPWWKFIELK